MKIRIASRYVARLFSFIPCAALLATADYAVAGPLFSDNGTVTAAALEAVSSGNQFAFSVPDHHSGNVIDAGAFSGGIGIQAVTQNTAVGANVQQAIVVNGNMPVVTLSGGESR